MLREKLPSEGNLRLDDAVETARHFESSKQAQSVVRQPVDVHVNRFLSQRHPHNGVASSSSIRQGSSTTGDRKPMMTRGRPIES